MRADGALWLLLLSLLCTACSQPSNVAQPEGDQPTDPAAIALQRNCSSCHAPPHGNRHTAAEWPQVVSRMELHRLQRGFDTIPPAERAALLALLQAGAKEQ
ncbi:MAG: hypothetical protein Q9M13_01070 [Mariprofundales bacterium]|nr:hypothetical protein [Mariprofundales bacterium]